MRLGEYLTMESPVTLANWGARNGKQFSGQVCHKLAYKGQMFVMLVGGPNDREDFHLEHGPEFFFQIYGNMRLVVIERRKRKVIEIKEGQVFLLPPLMPHCPQRPEPNSLGLVLERQRQLHEMDALRVYKDHQRCNMQLWERYFHCADLETDLAPVIDEWNHSEERQTREVGPESLPKHRSIIENSSRMISEPFDLWMWLADKRKDLDVDGAILPLFSDATLANSCSLNVHGYCSGKFEKRFWMVSIEKGMDTFVLQLKGKSKVFLLEEKRALAGNRSESNRLGHFEEVHQENDNVESTHKLEEFAFLVIRAGVPYRIEQDQSCSTLVGVIGQT